MGRCSERSIAGPHSSICHYVAHCANSSLIQPFPRFIDLLGQILRKILERLHHLDVVAPVAAVVAGVGAELVVPGQLAIAVGGARGRLEALL